MPLFKPAGSTADPPRDLICPITQEIFHDPVVAEDGFTYDAKAITSWLKTKASSPLTQQHMGPKLVKNMFVKTKIAEFLDANSNPLALPAEWPQLRGVYPVDLTASDVKPMVDHFLSTLGNLSACYQVRSLQRNINPTAWRVFAEKRREMGGMACEAYLIHGPKTEDNLDGILESSFFIDPARRAGVLGQGVYGADSLAYVLATDLVVWTTPGKNRAKCIISRFLLGKTKPGHTSLCAPPPGAHSAMASARGGTVFCVYSPEVCYPEFVLTLQTTGVPLPESEAPTSPSCFALLDAVRVDFKMMDNPIVEMIYAPEHPCKFRATKTDAPKKGIIFGRALDDATILSVRDVDGGNALVRIPDTLVTPDDVAWLPPWRAAGVLFRCDERATRLITFLQNPIEGLKSFAPGVKPTFMSVFNYHRDSGIMLFVFGGAVRHALQGDFQGINDVDVTFGAPPAVLAKEGGYRFSPVECMGIKVRWGSGTRVMEGNCMLGAVSSCFVLHSSQSDCIVTSDLVANLITIDFACNSVLFDPVSRVFIDVTGHGLHDIIHKRLRIPVAQDMWEPWLHHNTRKVFRYWKMRVLGYQPATQDMHDFLLRNTVDIMDSAKAAEPLLYMLGKTKKKISYSLPLLQSIMVSEVTDFLHRTDPDKASSCKPDDLWKFIAEAYAAME